MNDMGSMEGSVSSDPGGSQADVGSDPGGGSDNAGVDQSNLGLGPLQFTSSDAAALAAAAIGPVAFGIATGPLGGAGVLAVGGFGAMMQLEQLAFMSTAVGATAAVDLNMDRVTDALSHGIHDVAVGVVTAAAPVAGLVTSSIEVNTQAVMNLGFVPN